MTDMVCLACVQKLWSILPLFMLTQKKIPGPLPPYCKQQGPWNEATMHKVHYDLWPLSKWSLPWNQFVYIFMPTPHPAHMRRRGLVLQILGQVSKREANQITGIYWKMQKYFNWSLNNDIAMRLYDILQSDIVQHWPICNPTLTITRLQCFHKPKDLDLWHQTSSPHMSWMGSGHETTFCKKKVGMAQNETLQLVWLGPACSLPVITQEQVTKMVVGLYTSCPMGTPDLS